MARASHRLQGRIGRGRFAGRRAFARGPASPRLKRGRSVCGPEAGPPPHRPKSDGGGKTELAAEFDWKELDRSDRYLDELEIPWRETERDKRAKHSGTALEISRLRDEWNHDRIDRLRLGLERLIGPGLDDEFRIFLDVDGVPEEVTPRLDAAGAMYSLEGRVGSDGVCEIRYSDITDSEEIWERSVVWPRQEEKTCGPLEFRINAWDLDRDALQFFFEKKGLSMGLRDFRRMVRDHSGISLYRDSFRILPYGEPDNDWLRLDRRRVNNPTLRLSNNQILGWIHLTADENPGLKDQTNREGLVANEAYEHLQQVVLELLGYLEARRSSARRLLGLGPRNDSRALPHVDESAYSEIEALVERLDKPLLAAEVGPRLRDALARHQEASQEAIRQYAGLAAQGQIAGLVMQQLDLALRQLSTELENLGDELEDADLSEEVEDTIAESRSRLGTLVREMRTRVEKIDPLAVTRRRTDEVVLDECVRDVLISFRSVFAQGQIDARIRTGDGPLVVRTDPTTVRSALALVFDNACYWAAQAPRNTQRVISTKVEGAAIAIENTGPLISKEVIGQLFEPHFTTRDEAAGMGLTLARDLLGSVGATIEVDKRKRKGARFVVRF